MTTKAYKEGKKDKENRVLEPTVMYSPGSKEYAEYVKGFMSDYHNESWYPS